MRLDRAIDFFQGEQARKGRARRTRDDYFRKLVLLCPKEGDCPLVRDVSADDCRSVLDRWRDSAPGTRYHSWAVLSSFFGWLYRAGVIEVNPMARIEPPSRHHSEDLPVTTVSANDVRRLFDACETWHELLCLSTLAYLGPRRRAASGLRRRDLDLDRATLRFREKGGKVITKPLPEEFAELLRQASAAGVIGTESDAYVIPMIRKQRRGGERDDRIVWRTIKCLGARAGVEVTPHSLRAAFAVLFLERTPVSLRRCSG
jgi:integrase